MNKYQEALNELWKQRHSGRYKVYQKGKDWNTEIKEYDKFGNCLTTLQELVDKTTPKKPKRKRIYYNCHNGECDKAFIYYCPVCNFSCVEDMNYCPECGQRLER